MTVAEKISKQFNDDGQCFADECGLDLTCVCEDECRTRDYECDKYRYWFEDNSSIVICGDAWDLGVEGCKRFCWDGLGCTCDENGR